MSIDGIDELNSIAFDLTRAGMQAGARASQAVRKTAADMQGTAQIFAPVDTGNLKNSITSSPIGQDRELRPGDLDAEIGPTADYGHHVEDGTSRHAPQAYMGPSFDRHAHQMQEALEQIGGDVL